MKNARFSEAQIMAILRQAENGVPVSELCRGSSVKKLTQWINFSAERHEQRQLLQVAGQAWRNGRFDGFRDESDG